MLKVCYYLCTTSFSNVLLIFNSLYKLHSSVSFFATSFTYLGEKVEKIFRKFVTVYRVLEN